MCKFKHYAQDLFKHVLIGQWKRFCWNQTLSSTTAEASGVENHLV